MPEYPQINDRVLLVQFPDDEGGKTNGGDDGQRDDLGRGEPVEILAFIQHQLQRTDPDDEPIVQPVGFNFGCYQRNLSVNLKNKPVFTAVIRQMPVLDVSTIAPSSPSCQSIAGT